MSLRPPPDATVGDVILPTDPAYDDARGTFNGTIDRRPAAIVRPGSTAEVAAAVGWARDAGLHIAVRGGGHSVAGHAVADGALVIDLRRLRDVSVDPSTRRACVGGGALWEDVDRATAAHGLAMPGGTFADTGVGGLTLGGGLGFLLGTGGLTCDNLVRADVVTADGSVVTAGEGGDADLLWALRGGGGNFGVVTSFEFVLQPVGPMYAGYLSVPIDAAAAAMAAAAKLARVAPPELTVFVLGPTVLAADHPVAPGATTFDISICFQGSPEAAELLLRPLRALPIVNDGLATRTYLAVQEMSGRLPFGLRHYWKGHFLRDLDDSAIGALVDGMTRSSESSFVLCEAITGAARTEPAGGAAFGQREARWNVSAMAIWEDPAKDESQIAWSRAVNDALLGSSFSGAGYANYASADETPARVRAAFGADRFDRLREIKRRYDPDNVFRFNLNIPI